MLRDRLAKLKTEALEQAGFIWKAQQNNIKLIYAKNKYFKYNLILFSGALSRAKHAQRSTMGKKIW